MRTTSIRSIAGALLTLFLAMPFLPMVAADEHEPAEPALEASVAMGAASYAALDAATEGIDGVVTATLDGVAVEGATVSVSITRQPWISNVARETRVTGVTDADGRFAFDVPDAFTLPGGYVVAATVELADARASAETAYTVG